KIFTSPTTWYGLLIACIAGRLTGYTADQVMVQRFQTAKSIRAVRQGFLITALSDTLWMVILTFIGVVLVIYFKAKLPHFHEYFAGRTDELFAKYGDKLPA